MSNPGSSYPQPRDRRSNGIVYVIKSVVFIAWPLALFVATFDFFPFEVHNPLEHPNPVAFILIWTIVGIVIGSSNWRRQPPAMED